MRDKIARKCHGLPVTDWLDYEVAQMIRCLTQVHIIWLVENPCFTSQPIGSIFNPLRPNSDLSHNFSL